METGSELTRSGLDDTIEVVTDYHANAADALLNGIFEPEHSIDTMGLVDTIDEEAIEKKVKNSARTIEGKKKPADSADSNARIVAGKGKAKETKGTKETKDTNKVL